MRIVAVVVFILTLSACQKAPPFVQRNDHASTQLMIENFFLAFNSHDSRALSNFYTEDAQVLSPEKCEPTIGRAAIAANYQSLFDAIPDVHDDLGSLVIQGENVALTFVASSKIEGREFALPIAAFMALEDGLISRDEAYFDTDVTPNC